MINRRAVLALLCVVAFCAIVLAQAERKANPSYEPVDPAKAAPEKTAAWEKVAPGLHAAVGSVDVRYKFHEVPIAGIASIENDAQEKKTTTSEENRAWKGCAWRGERVHAQLVLWTRDPVEQVRFMPAALTHENGEHLPQAELQTRFVRYTLGDKGLQPDILDTTKRLDMPAMSVRPLWVTVDVPRNAAPGIYKARLEIKAKAVDPIGFDFLLEVLPWTLPPLSKGAFHLDLWQNPYALARYHHVEPWSDEHFAIMEPHMRMLVDAGQKVLTATILHQAWGTQTFDPYDSMVEWIRQPDGGWVFDFTNFDRWVKFGTRMGLDNAINCYSTIPWSNQVRYREAQTGNYEIIKFVAGDENYKKLWPPFLKAFSGHLENHGWLDRVCLAMDERPPEQMRPAIELIREHAPGLKIALAGGNHPELEEEIHDWCVFITPPLSDELIRKRGERNRDDNLNMQTTYYVCCSPPRPNTFTDSPPAESAWLGWYAAARGFSGFLRWAYDSWVEDPFMDTRHVTWAAGDCFLVYPGARSSIRFERLREGIQAYEKIRILRAYAASSEKEEVKNAVEQLNQLLSVFTYEEAQKTPAAKHVNAATLGLEKIARELSVGLLDQSTKTPADK